MDFEHYQRDEDNYRFLRTTCGLVGFIVFFTGSFIAFIAAGESESHYAGTAIFGSALLLITSLFFCCVLNESNRIFDLTDPSEGIELRPLMPRPEPGLPINPQPESDQELRWPSGDSDETVESEIDPDPDLQALRKMAKSGLPAEGKGSTTETSENSQDKDSKNREGEWMDVELDYTKAGPSKVAERSSEVIESKSDISALKGMLTLSLSDSAIGNPASVEKKETENVSDTLHKMSLEDSKKQAAETAEQGPSSGVSEGKSYKQDAETSKDTKDVKPYKSE